MKSILAILGAAIVAGLLLAAGCGSNTAPESVPSIAATPVSDLSSLSSANVVHPPPKAARAALEANGDEGGEGSEFSGNGPGLAHRVGPDYNPGMERLLNQKAAQYASFSRDLLDRLFNQVFKDEREEQFARLKISDDVKPVVITATLDKRGKLTELVLEQHSGKAAVDHMVLEACKKSLWSQRPPEGAATADGTYKVRLETKITNFASMDSTHWFFETDIGIAVL
jgi:outer membrane murein-binding lipoprotein Lpp